MMNVSDGLGSHTWLELPSALRVFWSLTKEVQ